MSYTKGKLETRGFYAVNERGRAVFDCGPIPMDDEEIKANARRLVACWNAFDGVPQDDVEELAKMPNAVMNLARYAEDTTKERDELVKALKECQLALEPYDDVKPRDWKTDREKLAAAHQNVHAILARYQEGK